MNSSQLTRWLRREHGCDVVPKRGTGHVFVYRGEYRSVVPTHGGRKQLGKGLIRKIMNDLHIEGRLPN